MPTVAGQCHSRVPMERPYFSEAITVSVRLGEGAVPDKPR